MSECLDHPIRAYERKRCGAVHISHIPNSVPVTNNQTRPQPPHNRVRHEPHAKELYHHFTTKYLFETSRQVLGIVIPGLIYLVRERNLLVVTLG